MVREASDRGSEAHPRVASASGSAPPGAVGPPAVAAGSSPTGRTRPRACDCFPPARSCCDRGTGRAPHTNDLPLWALTEFARGGACGLPVGDKQPQACLTGACSRRWAQILTAALDRTHASGT